ncbi:hypothetical protein, partial [Xanthomonas graminis]|uniref:hypothetical protein n=1 Tax=Xanthomonas graminis TaxID=3390026 RepID=UPI0020C7D261
MSARRARLTFEHALVALAVVGHAPVQHQGGLARLAHAGGVRIAEIEHAADRGVDLLEFGDVLEQRARAR